MAHDLGLAVHALEDGDLAAKVHHEPLGWLFVGGVLRAAGDPDGGQRGDGADSHEAEAAVTGVS
ncbi:hypothetical protein [Streptomyces exfoliatus]|uniref:hypothetical protein n=1 Tax=Streptomyces exfoliatus TaxID=1905 RepID=UPI0004CD5DE5|nr:hypothetical protein [Streptomyces exfoliatus]